MGSETRVRLVADTEGYISSLDKAEKKAGNLDAAHDRLKRTMDGAVAALKRSSDAAAQYGNAVSDASAKGSKAAQAFIADAVQQAGIAQKLREEFVGSMSAGAEMSNALEGALARIGPAATAAVVALGVLTMMLTKGTQEQRAFDDALILTGNHAGVTASGFRTMSEAVSGAVGTQGKAAETLTKLAETGKIAGAQFVAIAEAVELMEIATGAAVDETIAKFTKLADDPVKASVQLNEQFHYLTASVYDQIVALDEQNRKEEATAVAQKALADRMKERAEQVVSNLGYMQRAWMAVKQAAASAWDAMLGVGRSASLDDLKSQIAAKRHEIDEFDPSGFKDTGGGAAFGQGGRGSSATLKALKDQLAALETAAAPLQKKEAEQQAAADRQRQDDERIAAQARLNEQAKQMRSRHELRDEERQQLDRDAKLTGMSAEEYNKRAAAIDEKYKDPKGRAAPKPKAFQDDAGAKLLQQLRDQDAATVVALASNEKLTTAEKQQAEFLQKISDLKSKPILTADQKSLLASEGAIRAQLAQNVEHERALKLKQEMVKLEEKSAQLNEQIANYQQNQRDQYDRQLSAIGKGSDAVKNAEAVKSIYAEYQKAQWQLEKSTPADLRGSDQYLAEKAKIQAELKQSLKDYDDYYSSLKAKQADWTNGATEAVANYVDASNNLMAQAANTANDMFKGMEDALTSFVTTGKISFKSLADSIIQDITRIIMKQAMAGLLGSLGGSMFGATGAAFNGASSVAGSFGGSTLTGVFLAGGGYVSGPGTGTSDSVPANLSNGEFVVTAAATAKNRGALESMNAGKSVRAFASGGIVGASRSLYEPSRDNEGSVSRAIAGRAQNVVNVSLHEDPDRAGQVQQQPTGGGINIKAFVEKITERTVAGQFASGQGMIPRAAKGMFGMDLRYR